MGRWVKDSGAADKAREWLSEEERSRAGYGKSLGHPRWGVAATPSPGLGSPTHPCPWLPHSPTLPVPPSHHAPTLLLGVAWLCPWMGCRHPGGDPPSAQAGPRGFPDFSRQKEQMGVLALPEAGDAGLGQTEGLQGDQAVRPGPVPGGATAGP